MTPDHDATIQALRAQAKRDCEGDGRTHYHGCPCSVLNVIEGLQADVKRLIDEADDLLRIIDDLLQRIHRLTDALTETDCLHNQRGYLRRNGIEPVPGRELSQLWQFAINGKVESE
jgi:hypothetical protein